MNRTFLIADTHFGHKNIIKYCNRPFNTVKHMDDILRSGWNAVVQPEDTVYHLGDFTMDKNQEVVAALLSKLNGHKHLIIGNHDYLKIWGYVEAGFESVHTSLKIKIGEHEVYLAHDPAVKVALPKEATLLHGHIHGLWLQNVDNHLINVGVDVWSFAPASEEELIPLIEMKTRWG